jgi:hypothetical protein
MSNKSIADKLLIKPGYSVLFVNAPQGYSGLLGELSAEVAVLKDAVGRADVIQAFVSSKKELEGQLPGLKKRLKPEGLLWVTYPKGTSRLKADINRDSIAAYAKTLGLQAVAMISIDDIWSALRLKTI